MKNKLINIVILVFIFGCSKNPIDTMNEMNKNTSEMKKTTKQLNLNTSEMKDITKGLSSKTSNMKDITEFLYRQNRKIETIKAQEIALRGLRNAKSMERKIYYAVMFTNSLEYTLWTSKDSTGDSKEYLYDLYYEGIQNVSTLVLELLSKAGLNIEDIKNISPASNDLNKQSLMALSYALGEKASEQKGLARRYNITAQSFFEISAYFLKKTSEKNSDHYLKNEDQNIDFSHRYIRELTASDNKRIIINLINLRMNFYSAMIISKTSSFNKKYSKYSFGIISMYHKVMFLFNNWTASFGTPGESLASKKAKLSLINSWALKAISAKNFLIQIGEKPILDISLQKILKNMSFSQNKRLNSSEFQKNIRKLLGL